MEALAAAHPFEADFVRVVAELVNDMSDLVHSQSVRERKSNRGRGFGF